MPAEEDERQGHVLGRHSTFRSITWNLTIPASSSVEVILGALGNLGAMEAIALGSTVGFRDGAPTASYRSRLPYSLSRSLYITAKWQSREDQWPRVLTRGCTLAV